MDVINVLLHMLELLLNVCKLTLQISLTISSSISLLPLEEADGGQLARDFICTGVTLMSIPVGP